MSSPIKSKSEVKGDKQSGNGRNDRSSGLRTSSSNLSGKMSSSTKAERKGNGELATPIVKSPRAKSDADKSIGKSKSSTSEKGILKNKKNLRVGDQTKKTKDKKKKAKPRKKSTYEKIAQNLGFYVGNVVLRDPRAIEAAQALDLQQKHLRRLRVKFDKIDIDGSGNIDYDEFFESVGETRSPFTDKLFSLIGTVFAEIEMSLC